MNIILYKIVFSFIIIKVN